MSQKQTIEEWKQIRLEFALRCSKSRAFVRSFTPLGHTIAPVNNPPQRDSLYSFGAAPDFIVECWPVQRIVDHVLLLCGT